MVRYVKIVDDNGYRKMVATRRIPRGTIMIQEKPLVRIKFPNNSECGNLFLDEEKGKSTLIRDVVDTLPQLKRRAFFRLLDHRNEPNPSLQALRRIQTNAWNDDEDGRNGLAVFHLLSLINHSCVPNAFLTVANGKLIASTDIEKGSEIFVNYREDTGNKKLRRKRLRLDYGFWCQCDLCTGKMRPAAARKWMKSRNNFIQKTDTYV